MLLNDDCVHVVVEYLSHVRHLLAARAASRQLADAVRDVLVFRNGKCCCTLDGTNLQARDGAHVAAGIDGPAEATFRLAALVMRGTLTTLRVRDAILPFDAEDDDDVAPPITIAALLPQLHALELRDVYVLDARRFRAATRLTELTFAGLRSHARAVVTALAENSETALRTMKVTTFPQTRADVLEALCAEGDDSDATSSDDGNSNEDGSVVQGSTEAQPTLVRNLTALAFHLTDRIREVSLALPPRIAAQLTSLSFAVFEGVGSGVDPLATLPELPNLRELRIKSLPGPARLGSLRAKCPRLRVLTALIDSPENAGIPLPAVPASGRHDDADDFCDSWPGLERVELDGTPEDVAVAGLRGRGGAAYRCLAGSAPTLRHLALAQSALATSDVEHVFQDGGMPALELLYVPSCRRLTPSAFAAIARGAPALTNLDVSNTAFNDGSLRAVAGGLPTLRALAATLCADLRDLSPLHQHAGLEWLAVGFAACRNLHAVASMPRLHTLTLTGVPPSLRDARAAATSAGGGGGEVCGLPECPGDVSALASCPSLTSLCMRGGVLAPTSFASWSQPDATLRAKLRSLVVRDCAGLPSADPLRWVGAFTRLEHLVLASNSGSPDDARVGAHGDSDAPAFTKLRARLPRLRYVEIG